MKQVEIPDFDDMFKLAEEIGKLTREKLILEHTLEVREAWIVRRVVSDPKYFVGGKSPSMEFIKKTYLITGLVDEDGGSELIKQRAELTEKISELEKSKLRFQVYRDMIDVWRTVSANQRAAVA